jgi:hypothetical protein
MNSKTPTSTPQASNNQDTSLIHENFHNTYIQLQVNVIITSHIDAKLMTFIQSIKKDASRRVVP